jgi:hypothetical protein
VPGVVPGFGGVLGPLEHPDKETTKSTRKNERASAPMDLRLRLSEMKINRQANVASAVSERNSFGELSDALVAVEVRMVRVAVTGVVPLMATLEVDPKLKVGGSTAPVGLDVRAATKLTVPVNPPAGVTVIVVVLPVVLPGVVMVTLEEVMAQLGGTVTLTGAVVLAFV